jgi:N-acetylmuramoyl-L-alanine amidase
VPLPHRIPLTIFCEGAIFVSVKRRKLILALAVIFAVNILIIALAQSAQASLYKKGMSGQTVTAIQTRLKSWGYYSGAVDGVYGSATEKAVKYFQSKNGLAADGQAGDKTLAALGLYDGGAAIDGDTALLARLISAEARGEPYVGQVAVGAVVLNRVEHPSFPNTISGVIYQSGAFSCLDDGQFWQPVSDSAYRAAREALAGWDPTGGAIYYFNPAKATSKWIWSRPLLVVIGDHRFCS